MNSNMSESYKKSYGQEAHPTAGSTIPAHKDGRGCDDTLTAKHETASVREAKAEVGAAKKAVQRQCGHPNKHIDNMITGGNTGMGPNVVKNVSE